MTHTDLYSILEKMHTLQGLVIKAMITNTVTPEMEAKIKEEAEAIAASVNPHEPSHDDNLSQTLASMYMDAENETPQEALVESRAPEKVMNEEEEDDYSVHQIIAPAFSVNQGLEESDAEQFYTDSEEEESLQMLEEDEDVSDGKVEGKNPDLSFITINERARFRRELFDDNKERFDECITVIQDTNGFSEAKAYLCDDLEWNPEVNNVQAEFIEKIYECFRLAR